jgi:hypothetical protein
MTATYDRERAYEYASKHWNIPCHDNKIDRIGLGPLDVVKEKKKQVPAAEQHRWTGEFRLSTLNPATGAVEVEVFGFKRDDGTFKVVHGWDGLGDCAHFVSKCFNHAGLTQIDTNYVPTLEKGLRKLSITQFLAIRASEERAAAIIAKGMIRKGDVILYWDTTGKELGGGYTHSALWADTGITCHTKMRFNNPWNLANKAYTLIHFKHDENPPLVMAKAIGGWWEVSWRGTPYYYNFRADNTVTYGRTKPRGKSPAPPTDDVGHWRDLGLNQIDIVWQKSGSIELYDVAAGGATMTGKWNSSDPLNGRKL